MHPEISAAYCQAKAGNPGQSQGKSRQSLVKPGVPGWFRVGSGLGIWFRVGSGLVPGWFRVGAGLVLGCVG